MSPPKEDSHRPLHCASCHVSAPLCQPCHVVFHPRSAGAPFGIYIHVPFCVRRCGYCAFVTTTLADPGSAAATERTDRFVEGAVAEIARAALHLGASTPTLTSIYLGGGTPTMLSSRQVGRILDEVRRHFDVRDRTEISIESNPDSLMPGQLVDLREAGVTRVSFGLQSVRERILSLLDRTHSPELALESVGLARDAGFEHVGLDLIYGTPGETERDWRVTLDSALGVDIDHLSAYALGVESGTKLAARIRRGELPEPSADDAADRYLIADDVIGRAGFDWYEISNWARGPSSQCSHNLLYWRNHDWWGIGPGAHSHIEGTRWWNLSDADAWATAVLTGQNFTAGHEVLDAEQRSIETTMLGIRLAEGLALPGGRRLVLTTKGRLLADSVVRRLVA